MRERPILFSGPMVRALLDGRKTQTRRIVKPQFAPDAEPEQMSKVSDEGWQMSGHSGRWWDAVTGSAEDAVRCPYGVPGDTLWVREAHAIVPRTAYARSEGVQQTLRPDDDHDACVYREGWERSRPGKWRPSIHMPRWASRLTLEITDVRVERLQNISEADAQAEGCPCYVCDRLMDGLSEDDCHCFHRKAGASDYRYLWEAINGADSWAANPWVWAVSFNVQKGGEA